MLEGARAESWRGGPIGDGHLFDTGGIQRELQFFAEEQPFFSGKAKMLRPSGMAFSVQRARSGADYTNVF